MKNIALVMWVLLLAGCAVSTVDTEMSDAELIGRESSLLTGVPAADNLLQEGESARQRGDYETAVNSLERGIRMAPRSAALYLALAKTRLAMAQFNNASQMAQRAVTLLPAAPQGAELTAKMEAWIVVAQAREQQGDSAGAQRAREHAEALR